MCHGVEMAKLNSLTSTAVFMMSALVLILFLAMQRRFVAGLGQGGIKG